MGLETRLHEYLKAQGGKHIPYEEIKSLVERVWQTPKGGHYRMETLTRRWRKDKYRANDNSDRIGKDFKGNAIIALYYKTDSFREVQEILKACCGNLIQGLKVHSKDCPSLKVKEEAKLF